MAFIYILRKWSLICRAWFLIAHWQFSVNWSYWALEMRKHYCCMDDELKAINNHFSAGAFSTLTPYAPLFFFVLIQLYSVLFSAKSQKPLLRFALRSLSPNHTPWQASLLSCQPSLLLLSYCHKPLLSLLPTCSNLCALPSSTFLCTVNCFLMADPRYLN